MDGCKNKFIRVCFCVYTLACHGIRFYDLIAFVVSSDVMHVSRPPCAVRRVRVYTSQKVGILKCWRLLWFYNDVSSDISGVCCTHIMCEIW